MTRIADIFSRARAERRRLVLPFFTAGDPDLATTARLLSAAKRAGVEIAELGIPFSDPIADGPVIAQSMFGALQRGVTPRAIFDAVRGQASSSDWPALVAMVSVSIVRRAGVAQFVADAAQAGFAGLIVPDIDLDDATALTAACDERGLSCAYLVAPTTSGDRLRAILQLCRGFVYLLARAGITGESAEAPDIHRSVEAVRSIAPQLAIAAGFGIATPEHVRDVTSHPDGHADGAIVGSALVRCIAAEVAAKRDPIIAVERLLREFVAAASSVAT